MPANKAVIFDMDGTLADCRHRMHYLKSHPKDWKNFLHPTRVAQDKPVQAIVQLAKILYLENELIIVTGRPRCLYNVTKAWLQDAELDTDNIYMRPDGDFRPDYVVKSDLLAKIRLDDFEPWLVVDDRQSVVDMWRSAGLTCLQAAADES